MKSERTEVPESVGTSESVESSVGEYDSPADSCPLDKRSVAQIRADNSVEEVSANVQEFARKISRSKTGRAIARTLLLRRVDAECKRLELRAALRNASKKIREVTRRVWPKFRK